MKKLKNVIKLFLICLITLLIFNNVYMLAATVTDEKIKESLEKFVLSELNENNYKISVSNNTINIEGKDEKYLLNYDLTDKPKFTFEILIKKGMSYESFEKQIRQQSTLAMICYMAVANIQGIKMEDACQYFLMSNLASAFQGAKSLDNSYVIIDDIDQSGGAIEKDRSDPKKIYASEFGERVIEYVKATYKDKQTFKDSTDEINSYEWTIERKDISDTSCKLISSLIVNPDADFSKVKDNTSDKITKENADYAIVLKVGQKCKIESNEKVTGHEIYNYQFIEINKEYTEITAKKSGVSKVYLFIGEEKKSVYITVEENSDNTSLEPITLKIENIQKQNTKEEKESQQTKIDKLPRTGEKINYLLIALYIIVGACSVGLLILLFKKIK